MASVTSLECQHHQYRQGWHNCYPFWFGHHDVEECVDHHPRHRLCIYKLRTVFNEFIYIYTLHTVFKEFNNTFIAHSIQRVHSHIDCTLYSTCSLKPTSNQLPNCPQFSTSKNIKFLFISNQYKTMPTPLNID